MALLHTIRKSLTLLYSVVDLSQAAANISPNSCSVKLLPGLFPIRVFPSAKYWLMSCLKRLRSRGYGRCVHWAGKNMEAVSFVCRNEANGLFVSD